MINLKFSENISCLAKGIILIVIFTCWSNTCFGQKIAVPENIQAALLTKVLKYNPQIPQDNKIKILVVYNNNTVLDKDEFIKGLGSSMVVKAITPKDLERNISEFNVVYFMEGINGFSKMCRINKVLSVTATTRFVEEGEISLGFGIENNKPKILVNLTSLDMEGQSFSSDILRIGKIFK
ncbi:YfiR/HmsC family protein [Algibacter sp. L3A6]|uniref:YfiR/HmsC family protein n=1 Tax=Algibacter sp. L3A6 TaxID=2686366 RepID=UPI00131EC559|nr:YfiR/HmsC family protein [Algibacter sp. L3A6]